MTHQPPAPPPPAVPAGPTPLWAPLPNAGFAAAVARFFRKYADFSGRASRREYWWFILFDVIVYTVLVTIGNGIGSSVAADGSLQYSAGTSIVMILSAAWVAATFVPHLALNWRRLHDVNLPGPWWFLSLVPFGGLVVLVFTVLPSNPAGARFDIPSP